MDMFTLTVNPQIMVVVVTHQELIMQYIVEVHQTMVSTELQQLEVSTQ